MIKFNINKMVITTVGCQHCKVDTGEPCVTKRWNVRPSPHQQRFNDYLKKKELDSKCSAINHWWDGRDREERCILDIGHNDRHIDADGYFWRNKENKIS